MGNYICQFNIEDTSPESMNYLMSLTHFMPLVIFYTSWKQKSSGYLMLSGGYRKTNSMKLINCFSRNFFSNTHYYLLEITALTDLIRYDLHILHPYPPLHRTVLETDQRSVRYVEFSGNISKCLKALMFN